MTSTETSPAPSVQALALTGEEQFPTVRVRSSVVFAILSNYVRRTEGDSRAIGTLLGNVKDGNVVEITDCFAVPHQEKVDDLYVAIHTEYHKSMVKFHNRVYKRDVVVGWYSTTAPSGALIVDNSSLIHDFYIGECSEPVHLVVDTSLQGETMGIKAFVSQPMVVGLNSFANMFHEVPVQIILTDGETACLHQMVQGQAALGQPWASSTLISSAQTDNRADLLDSLKMLSEVIDKLKGYVDSVVSGSHSADAEIGIAIAQSLDTVELIRPEELHANLQSRVKDLLMVSYINTLTQTQLAIADKLSAIL
jgi:translation initiation factor 3 subunit F